MKRCSKCGEEKDEAAYYALKPGKLMAQCRECQKAAVKRRIAENPERHWEWVRRSNARHWDRVLRSGREWKARNPEHVRTYKQAWVKANPEKVRAQARRRYYKRGGDLPTASMPWVRILRGDVCAYCGRPMQHVDHIEPAAKGGSHDWSNLTAACASCNQRKHDKPLLHFLLTR